MNVLAVELTDEDYVLIFLILQMNPTMLYRDLEELIADGMKNLDHRIDSVEFK